MFSSRSIKLKALASPFGLQPKGLAFVISKYLLDVDIRCQALDYGSRRGDFLLSLSSEYPNTSFLGVDLCMDDVEFANSLAADVCNVSFSAIQKNVALPFDSSSFRVIYMIGVLEHIADKKKILSELRRVVSEDGFLIIAVPGKHLFSFLDMGNFKFRFPSLHKRFVTWRHGHEYYKKKFSHNPYGLFGDVEIEAGWHYHFALNEFADLLANSGLKIKHRFGVGFFQRVIINIMFFLPFLRKPLTTLLKLDSFYFSSTELLFVCSPVHAGSSDVS